jgi:hypothetical protein
MSSDPSPDRTVLVAYLTRHVSDCHQAAHAARLADTLRYEPCSPTCANWLRYGVQPKNPRPNLRTGCCKGKAHRREYLGYAGRRVLVSRKWSGKTLADHRADRKAWLLRTLGLPDTDDPARYTGNRSRPATPTTCHPHNGSCTFSPNASDGTPRSPKPEQEPAARHSRIFRQPGGRHDSRGTPGW